jgi:uncharacterized protein (DUF58 family)
MRNDPEVREAVASFEFGFTHQSSRRAGEWLGRSTGSSVEFQDYREYTAGDDIRHLDWAAYARSNSLMVRMYRNEISPRTEVILDASRSMASGKEKSRLAIQLTTVLTEISARLGGQPVVHRVADIPSAPLSVTELDMLDDLPFDGRQTLVEVAAERMLPLRHRSVRIVISDFLFPHDPDRLIRVLARDAAALWLIQVLDPFEAEPESLGGRRLRDIETDERIDIFLDESSIAEYRRRLADLQQDLATSCRRAGGTLTTIISSQRMLSACANQLCECRLLNPV